jgi:hypothetical protein
MSTGKKKPVRSAGKSTGKKSSGKKTTGKQPTGKKPAKKSPGKKPVKKPGKKTEASGSDYASRPHPTDLSGRPVLGSCVKRGSRDFHPGESW